MVTIPPISPSGALCPLSGCFASRKAPWSSQPPPAARPLALLKTPCLRYTHSPVSPSTSMALQPLSWAAIPSCHTSCAVPFCIRRSPSPPLPSLKKIGSFFHSPRLSSCPLVSNYKNIQEVKRGDLQYCKRKIKNKNKNQEKKFKEMNSKIIYFQ